MAKILTAHGQRVQKSVFECDLTAAQFAKLKRRLCKLLDPAQDESLRFYRLCASCTAQVEVVGRGPPVETSPHVYIV